MAAFGHKQQGGCDCRLLRCKICSPEPTIHSCRWVHVTNSLPPTWKTVLVKGVYEDEGEPVYEEGFRSTDDSTANLIKGEWLDFSFRVTHWVIINE